MDIFLNIFFFLLGLALLIFGANYFVKGGSALAKKLRIPSFVIGLTIVAIGTSLPELAISIASSIKSSADLSVGNIVGSNLFNILFVAGIVAVISPIKIKKSTINIDLPILCIVSVLLLLFSADFFVEGGSLNIISRSESIVLLIFMIAYLTMSIIVARNKAKHNQMQHELHVSSKPVENQESSSPLKKRSKKELKTWQMVVFLILGLVTVAFGGECVSTTAKFLALRAGMSETLVGLTLVAFLTNAPELVTSIIAAKTGEKDMALGNLIGSNILNIVLILAVGGVIAPIVVSSEILVDMLIMFVATIIFSVLCFLRSELGKADGIILLVVFALYLVFVIVRNYCF